MLKPLLMLVFVAALNGCANQKATEEVGSAAIKQVEFDCERGQSLSVAYYIDRDIAIVKRANEEITLTQQPAASGFYYTNGPTTLRGKGDKITLTIGRMAAIDCLAR
ncbi:MliC family protein [Alteromonas sp. C1M14]|uniref:MliC family protein n=1 Tax=Alteromonas sp. C1M14 TaxID=2841567 RepID=UPI001C096A95|nr:MliC family protein [Alteromonas sp. C1M14]MBU2977105.1 MliC family protein [Alteromonas sp. C1M14]